MSKRLLTGLLAGLGLCTTALAQTLRPGALPGEGEAQYKLELRGPQAAAQLEKTDLGASARGVQPAGGRAGDLLFKPVAVGLVNPAPFVAFSSVWEGQRLFGSNVAVELRSSADGQRWSAWAPLKFDGHASDDAARRSTETVQLDAGVRLVQVRAHLSAAVSAPALARVQLNFYSPGATPAGLARPTEAAETLAPAGAGRAAAAVCPKPAVVARASWGARAPSSQNGTTAITHLVIHHEAGPNTAANGDWAARVRAVQNLHMSTNGWADIGYAFLIDPNGVVYEGRAGGEDVLGAHWCGGNRNAMGVCMLGTYTAASPTAAAKASLEKLMAWKASKNGIDPLAKSTHYAAGFVNNVCVHRDNGGCSSCPGDQLYSELAAIRANISSAVNACNGTTPTGDAQAPTTSIGAPGASVSADFTATFTDADNVGVTERYYQVLESADGAEWRANRGNGFFNDNFNAAPLNAEWTARTGTWAVNAAAHLQQTTTTLTNTNVSTALTQGSGQSYLYHFAAKLNSTTGNRRFGLHIMASDVTAQERGDSYLIWVSADDQKVRIIETVANVLNERVVANQTTGAGAWADYKVTYNSGTGVVNVFVNERLAATWTDPSPLASGSGISLRTNQADVEFDDLKVYKSRATAKLVTVGTASSKDLRRASPNPATPTGKIKSLVRDAAGNWSDPGNLDLVVSLPAAAAAPARATAFPNPLTDGATLRYSLAEAGPVRVALYNDRGQRLAVLAAETQAAGPHTLEMLPLKNLPAGTYHVRLEGAGRPAESLTLRKE